MSIDNKRILSARGLLILMVSMLIFSSLHVHHDVKQAGEECYQCTHHHPHNGHLTTGQFSFHDCLICQMTTTPFVAAALLLFIVPVTHPTVVTTRHRNVPCRMAWDNMQTRAPPFL